MGAAKAPNREELRATLQSTLPVTPPTREGLHSAPRLYSINATKGEINDQHNNHCR